MGFAPDRYQSLASGCCPKSVSMWSKMIDDQRKFQSIWCQLLIRVNWVESEPFFDGIPSRKNSLWKYLQEFKDALGKKYGFDAVLFHFVHREHMIEKKMVFSQPDDFWGESEIVVFCLCFLLKLLRLRRGKSQIGRMESDRTFHGLWIDLQKIRISWLNPADSVM